MRSEVSQNTGTPRGVPFFCLDGQLFYLIMILDRRNVLDGGYVQTQTTNARVVSECSLLRTEPDDAFACRGGVNR